MKAASGHINYILSNVCGYWIHNVLILCELSHSKLCLISKTPQIEGQKSMRAWRVQHPSLLELHALTLAARSYALLHLINVLFLVQVHLLQYISCSVVSFMPAVGGCNDQKAFELVDCVGELVWSSPGTCCRNHRHYIQCNKNINPSIVHYVIV